MPGVKVILVVSKGKTLTWLDDCRIPYQSEDDKEHCKIGFDDQDKIKGEMTSHHWSTDSHAWSTTNNINEKGRFPANLLCSDDVLNDGKIRKTVPGSFGKTDYRQYSINHGYRQQGSHKSKEKIKEFGDEGSYSRYFDLDQWAKTHNILKAISLESYLITMGSREGDLVLSDSRIATENLKRKWMGKKKDCYY